MAGQRCQGVCAISGFAGADGSHAEACLHCRATRNFLGGNLLRVVRQVTDRYKVTVIENALSFRLHNTGAMRLTLIAAALVAAQALAAQPPVLTGTISSMRIEMAPRSGRARRR